MLSKCERREMLPSNSFGGSAFLSGSKWILLMGLLVTTHQHTSTCNNTESALIITRRLVANYNTCSQCETENNNNKNIWVVCMRWAVITYQVLIWHCLELPALHPGFWCRFHVHRGGHYKVVQREWASNWCVWMRVMWTCAASERARVVRCGEMCAEQRRKHVLTLCAILGLCCLCSTQWWYRNLGNNNTMTCIGCPSLSTVEDCRCGGSKCLASKCQWNVKKRRGCRKQKRRYLLQFQCT